jgi:hypothetical protein
MSLKLMEAIAVGADQARPPDSSSPDAGASKPLKTTALSAAPVAAAVAYLGLWVAIVASAIAGVRGILEMLGL